MADRITSKLYASMSPRFPKLPGAHEIEEFLARRDQDAEQAFEELRKEALTRSSSTGSIEARLAALEAGPRTVCAFYIEISGGTFTSNTTGKGATLGTSGLGIAVTFDAPVGGDGSYMASWSNFQALDRIYTIGADTSSGFRLDEWDISSGTQADLTAGLHQLSLEVRTYNPPA